MSYKKPWWYRCRITKAVVIRHVFRSHNSHQNTPVDPYSAPPDLLDLGEKGKGRGWKGRGECGFQWHQFPPKLGRVLGNPLPFLPPLPSAPFSSLSPSHPILMGPGISLRKNFDYRCSYANFSAFSIQKITLDTVVFCPLIFMFNIRLPFLV